VQQVFAYLPFTQRMARYTGSTVLELGMVSAALHNREFPFLGKSAERLCRAHLHRQIKDPELRKKLTPTYSFGCKRPTFANDYYPTFLRNNVELVTDGIACIEADGIVTRDGKKREIDTLILATGYKVWEKGNFPAFDVVGRDGIELGEWWNANGYQSYEGITVHGFPNLFYLASPYAFTGLSYFFTIEGQMKHIARCLGELRERGKSRFEVRRDAQQEFVDGMKARAGSTVFATGNCATSNSYYFNQHGEASLLRLSPTAVALWRAGHYRLDDYVFS
jgi:cation diffusion facilitator CzcD-associated flavoprotein CzcO